MLNLNGISYQEAQGSGELVFSPDGVTGRRIFIVAWADRVNFCKALLGYTHAVGHKPIRRAAQTFPGYDYLYCQNAVTIGLGQVSQGSEMIAYTSAKVTAEYRPLNFGTSVSESDDYDSDEEAGRLHIEETLDFGADYVSVDGSRFEYSDTSEKLGGSVGVLIGTVEMTLASSREPELDKAAIRSCLGRVNSTAWYSSPAEHVLFMGASARRMITSDGSRGWHVSYRFRERQVSWNKVLRGSQWVELSPKPYQNADFSALL